MKLRDASQADIPPFRSTYQTSIFLTTRLAVENESANAGARSAKDKARVAKWLAQPRMFQIGRTSAYPLPVSSDDYRRNFSEDEDQSCAVNIVECSSVQPAAKKLFPEIRSGSQISTSLLAASVAIAVPMGSRRFRRSFFPGKSSGVGPRLVPLTTLLLLALAGSVSLCVYWSRIADWLTEYGLGEPMSLFEGISVWPTILLRTVGFGLCVWLICHTLQRLKENIRDTEMEMRLEKPRLRLLRRPGIRLRGRSLGRRMTEMISQVWFPTRVDTGNRSADSNERPQLPIRHLAVRYRFEGRWAPRVTRAAIGTVAMFIVWLILAPIFGEPNVPARGSLARGIYFAVTMLDVIATLFLIFLVADATLYSRSFIKQLTAVRSKWPRQTVDYFAQTLGLRGENLDDWIDMQFLVKRTQCITSLIYHPFLMIALLLILRSRLFDNFTIPATLVITQLLSVAIVIVSVFALRWAAEEARASAVEHLTAKIIAAKGAEQLDVKVASQLEMMLARVENLRAGAFAPLSSQPFVKALLLPLLSYGGSMLAHLYALPGV